jgi:S1-C subfamily serine protease
VRRWLWVAAVGIASCGGGPARPDHPPTIEEERPATAPLPAPEPARQGELTRKTLDETLAAGPGALLARVHVEAKRDKAGFHGWRLVALPEGAPGGLILGDVLLRVNGQRLERPEDLSRLFEALRGASEIVVEIERDGAPRTLRVPVAD